MSELLRFTLNGEKMEIEVDPSMTLLDFLRTKVNLSGCKKGCAKGECGACTIILNKAAVTSCIMPVMKAMDGVVETIEGLEKDGKLHPLQQAFIDEGAVQCGYCIPGMILSAKALLDENPSPTKEEVKMAIGGNICRCTGYVKIEKAILSAAQIIREG